jgi:hypothetical protein
VHARQFLVRTRAAFSWSKQKALQLEGLFVSGI